MLEIVYISIFGVLITNMLDDFMEKGMIFRRYKYCLTVITKRKKILPFLYKPLGGCIICMNIWVTAGMYGLYELLNKTFWILSLFALSNYILKILLRYELL